VRRVPGRALTAHLERWIGLDPRSLALLRIGLGLAVAADAWIRSGDVVAHYADAGIVSRRDVLDEFAFLHRWAVSLHLAGGSAPFEAVLLGFAGLAGLALALGYRTRVAVLAAWFLTSSVQLRNLYIGAGYDALLRMLLLWGCFLPLGAAASIDALGRPGAEARRPHVSVAGLGLILQMAFVFGVAGYAKWLEPAWRSGTAVADIFADEMRAGRLAELLGGQASLLGAATYAVPWVEMVGAILFLSPVANGRLRAVAVLALALSVAAFGATLEVGLFPLVALAGLAGLLPRWFWEGPARRAGDALAGRRSASPAADGERRRVGRGLAGALSSALVAYVAFWNVGVARDPSFRAPRAVAWFGETLFLQQAWRMFAHPASRTGWLVMEGHLRDGRSACSPTGGVCRRWNWRFGPSPGSGPRFPPRTSRAIAGASSSNEPCGGPVPSAG